MANGSTHNYEAGVRHVCRARPDDEIVDDEELVVLQGWAVITNQGYAGCFKGVDAEEDPEEEEPDFETTLIDLYRRTNPAVVYIIVPPVGSGSGFVYSDEGYIVTNNHVVELGQEYEVVFATGERLSADLVGRDVDSDLAVIKVGQLPDGVKALALSPSADLEVGQFVIAIGNCASTGGVYQGNYNTLDGINKVIPVDVYIPGCPPRPEAIVDGVVKLIQKLRQGVDSNEEDILT